MREMRRVTRGPMAIISGDPDALGRFWLAEYAPEVIATEARRYPPVSAFREVLGGEIAVTNVPIPLDCADGFNEAYYGRPEMLLEPRARRACSAWSFVDAEAIARFERNLKRDLDDGSWDKKYGGLRARPTFHGSLLLIVSRS